jgi:O-6-methylguanine DNA methyltransferase
LAQAIGHPRAARAVGNVLNKNPFAPEVPCHRVVRSDGRVGGYAWGEICKVKLLKQEGIIIKGDRIRDFKHYFIKI